MILRLTVSCGSSHSSLKIRETFSWPVFGLLTTGDHACRDFDMQLYRLREMPLTNLVP